MEEEIRKIIWEGSIPISISYMNKPPLYVMVSRHTYLPTLNTYLKKMFHQTQPCSFQILNQHLPLHYPVGLLYDLYGNHQLPWKLTMVLASTTLFFDEMHIHGHFMSSLKEADCLRYGSAHRVMNLSKSDQSSLWEALLNQSAISSHWNFVQKLMIGNIEMLHVPFILYIKHQNEPSTSTSPYVVTVIQNLVPIKGKSIYMNERKNHVIVPSHG
jgi:hypothetical protein